MVTGTHTRPGRTGRAVAETAAGVYYKKEKRIMHQRVKKTLLTGLLPVMGLMFSIGGLQAAYIKSPVAKKVEVESTTIRPVGLTMGTATRLESSSPEVMRPAVFGKSTTTNPSKPVVVRPATPPATYA